MSSKVSFLSAFAGSCSGIAVFHRLRFQSWGRTVFHMILMGAFCALLITWGEVHRQKSIYQAGIKIFESVFGEKIAKSSSGLVPGKDPEKARSLLLPNDGRLFYLPQGRIDVPAEELEKSSFLVFWAPKGFATAVRSSGKWLTNIAQPGNGMVMLSNNKTFTTGELLKLKLVSKENWEFNGLDSLSIKEVGRTFFGVWTFTLFVQNLSLTLFLPVLYTAIFVGMFRLSSHGRYPVRLSYREFWKIGIYAGFPAMLVAAAFPALALPLFSFSTVYMAGLLIYWLYAAGRLERELAAEESNIIDEQ